MHLLPAAPPQRHGSVLGAALKRVRRPICERRAGSGAGAGPILPSDREGRAGVGRRAADHQHELVRPRERSEEPTSELQSLMRTSYAVFYLKKKNIIQQYYNTH